MKQNGNDRVKGAYYLGLDVGTNSVGWAVTDHDYNLLRCKGNAMWGARLFDEAQDASARRTSRINRRRLARRNQRLLLLETLFAEEIAKVDPSFFLRMEESACWIDDKTDKACRFSLFNDPGFTDKDYHRRYPTIYHLRSELMKSRQPHDVRLVYLALHHILKSRGHFLYDTAGQEGELRSLEAVLSDLDEYLLTEYDCSLGIGDTAGFADALLRSDLGIKAREKLLRSLRAETESAEDLDLDAVLDLLAGAKVKLSALFCDKKLSDAEIGSLSLDADLEEQFDVLSASLGDRVDLLLRLKDLYDTARLSRMLKGHSCVSEAKVALYEQNRRDLRALKAYVRQTVPERYREIFSARKAKLNNYAAYSGYRNRSGSFSCSQEDFCKYLRSVLPEPGKSEENLSRIYREIRDGVFLPKLKGSDNGVIPYQLHRMELRKILENAETYLPFLTEQDPDGNTVSDKILKTFEFRIPYYVGPLNPRSANAWAVRFPGKEGAKIVPWNFEKVIDAESSSVRFISNLIGRCTYTGERVLPKDSLLYAEFMLLNELNPLRVNGHPLKPEVKAALIRDLFENSRRKVTKKQIRGYLLSKGCIRPEDEISGIDDTVKTVLKSRQDFRSILDRTGDVEMVEEIIRHVLVFGEDRAMLKKWLRKNTRGLTEDDFSYICRLKYSDWGRLSRVFLTELRSADPVEETGEAYTVMDMLRRGDRNLMQLLSDRYSFMEQAQAHRSALFGSGQTLTEKLDSLYIAPAVRRSVRQTLRIVDEIVDIEKAVPEKIFIEMARDSAKELKGKRTESRKAKLLALYDACREESAALRPLLEREDEGRLRSDKLFLYYTQFGKCMYSGEPIDLDALMDGRLFDIDHIYPRSRIKDNSLDNRVVVKNTLNREKTNAYPIRPEIRQRMRPFWELLRQNGMISQKKYDRLVRSTPLDEAELSAFVARQLVETQQSTKALTTLLQERYGGLSQIVFSKAGNVSDFRHDYDMLKCRELNDLHHAKDAYLNIVVGNVYYTRFTKRFFENILNETYSLSRVFDFDVPGAWDKTETIKTVKRMMAKNNPLVTRMPREVKGQLFDLQPVTRTEAILPRKNNLPPERYGGYTGRIAAFFLVAEHSKGKRRVRTIEPVYVYGKRLFMENPLEYCSSVLKLKDPRIISSKILLDSLLEINGKRLFITGGSDSAGDGRDIYDLSAQLIMDYPREKYVRTIFKFLDRANALKTELQPTVQDGVSEDKNADLYKWFLNKLKAGVYSGIFDNERAVLDKSLDAFMELAPLAQCRILREILNMFRCNAVKANFTELCGKKVGNRIRRSCVVSSHESAVLIHQSVTGLFEVREDLLR